MRIHEALEIPEVVDLDEFITRLDTRDPERVRRDLAQFVVADNVFERLDKMLDTVGKRFAQGLDMGRYIYGTFGSGKSHLMAVLGRMFERDETVYDVGDPALSKLRANHPWMDRRRTLVVRLNMMGKASLVQGLYEAFNDALPEGDARLVFTDQEQVFRLIEKDAERLGGLDALIAQAVEDGAVPSEGFFRRGWDGDLGKQLDLAARLLQWRDHGQRTVRPEDLWVKAEQGFHRIAEHAKGLGYDGIVWLVDELIIWIRGKARHEYVEQINVLSALVDHDQKLARTVPFFVAVAVQQDIRMTCPEDLSEQGFHEQLGFISNRFSPSLELEDQDLFEVAARRVLKPRAEAREAFDDEVNKAFQKHAPAIRALSGDHDLAFVRKLYPFHPALLRVLVDVTQALSRSRTAMAALYGLLEAHRELEVGQFVPVGALYDILFVADNVDHVRQRKSSLAQRFALSADAYQRLEGKIDDVVRSKAGTQPRELQQLVRTVLLCQLSDRKYFPDGSALSTRITASTLLRLNQSDVRFMTERTGQSKVRDLFRLLATRDPQVQLTGDENDPFIAIKTESINIEAVLKRAQADVVHADRFAFCRRLLDDQLGLKLGTLTEARHTVDWRGTPRAGRVHLANVRKLTYAGTQNEFEPGDASYLLLVDYPFDEDTTCTRQDDIATLQRARERKRQWTLAWLPAHFTDTERQALDQAAAIEKVRGDQRRYLADYAPREAEQIARALESFQANQVSILGEAIRRCYLDEGEVHACSDLLDGVTHAGKDPRTVLDALAREVLDRRYPRHPRFKRRLRARELGQLADWVVRAAVTGQPVDLRGAEMEVVEAYGVPLEIVYAGSSSVTPRTDGSFLGAIHQFIGQRTRFRAGDLRAMLAGEGKQGFGFTDEVFQFFAYYLLQVEGYEAVRRGQGLTVDSLGGVKDDDELVKAEVVDHPTWDKARAIAKRLLGVTGRRDVPSVPEQSKLSRDAAGAAKRLRQHVERVASALRDACVEADVRVDDSHRAQTLRSLAADLQGIEQADTHVARTRLLAALHGTDRAADYAWLTPDPDAPDDPGSSTERLEPLPAERNALTTLDNARIAFKTVATRGTAAQRTEVVTARANLLRDPVSRPLAKFAPALAEKAQAVADGLIGPITDPPPPPPPPPNPDHESSKKAAGVSRGAAEGEVLALLRQALATLEGDRFDITLTVRRKDVP